MDIKYNPKLSIKKNAQMNGCSESAIRKYIFQNSIDRRYDRKVSLIMELRKIYSDGMSAYALSLKAKKSINTINKYWEYIISEKELSDFDIKKEQKVKASQPNEYYATHPTVTMDLLREETFHHFILEPACGGGFISEPLKQNGYDVLSTDLIDRGYGNGNIDFLSTEFEKGAYDIVTNPPYTLFIPFLLKAIEVCYNKVAMLLPVSYLSYRVSKDAKYMRVSHHIQSIYTLIESVLQKMENLKSMMQPSIHRCTHGLCGIRVSMEILQ